MVYTLIDNKMSQKTILIQNFKRKLKKCLHICLHFRHQKKYVYTKQVISKLAEPSREIVNRTDHDLTSSPLISPF